MDNVTVNEDEVINSLMNEIYGTVDGPQEEQTESERIKQIIYDPYYIDPYTPDPYQ